MQTLFGEPPSDLWRKTNYHRFPGGQKKLRVLAEIILRKFTKRPRVLDVGYGNGSLGRPAEGFEFMRAHQAKHRIATMSGVLGVSPSGYYAWCSRSASARAQMDASLPSGTMRPGRAISTWRSSGRRSRGGSRVLPSAMG
jgi:hypothetical protein